MDKLISLQKINLLTVIITFILLSSCSTENDCNTFFGYNGSVKSSLERVYEAEEKFGKWENGDIEYYGHSLTKFDKKGNYTEINQLDDDGELTRKIIPNRENGQIIEEVFYNDDGEKESLIKINFISANEIETESFDSNGEKVGGGKVFRENGKNVKSVFNQDNENKTITEWEYDKDGNQISQKMTDERGEIVFFPEI